MQLADRHLKKYRFQSHYDMVCHILGNLSKNKNTHAKEHPH